MNGICGKFLSFKNLSRGEEIYEMELSYILMNLKSTHKSSAKVQKTIYTSLQLNV
jgi:hypothetical protein